LTLFESFNDPSVNLLPKDGEVNYFGIVFSKSDTDYFFKELWENIAWKNDEALIFGKHFITKRKVAWYGDKPFEYSYSNKTKIALPWTDALKTIKAITETTTKETYNSCLLNLYHDGNEGMAWHSDAEKDLKKDGAIASLSFGAERKFGCKHKIDQTKITLPLENGSLLLMKGTTQTHWLHRLPPTTKITTPRINLTFRTIQY
jgi:alkylated DNA repair dioxygenase AlkB